MNINLKIILYSIKKTRKWIWFLNFKLSEGSLYSGQNFIILVIWKCDTGPKWSLNLYTLGGIVLSPNSNRFWELAPSQVVCHFHATFDSNSNISDYQVRKNINVLEVGNRGNWQSLTLTNFTSHKRKRNH